MTNQIYKMDDYRNHISEIPNVNLICTDPPFEIETHGKGIICEREYLNKIKSGFGNKFNPIEHLNILVNKCIPFNAYFFCNKSMIPTYLQWATEKQLNWDILTWIKPNPTPLKNNHYLPDIEYIIYMKESGSYFNDSLSFNYYRKYHIEESPRNFIHPCPKPLNLIKKFISVSCPENGTVLDPFLGSGATIQAAKELNINAYGYEINPIYEPDIIKRMGTSISNFSMEQLL